MSAKVSTNFDPLKDMSKALGGYRARVGILGDKAVRQDVAGITNSEIALVQILGSFEHNIPPRDFLLFPIEYCQRQIVRQLQASAVKAAFDRGDYLTVFKLLGLIAEGFIQQAFESSGFGQWAPNAESTIAAKGSDKPLIDTSQLRRGVTSEVVKKGTL